MYTVPVWHLPPSNTPLYTPQAPALKYTPAPATLTWDYLKRKKLYFGISVNSVVSVVLYTKVQESLTSLSVNEDGKLTEETKGADLETTNSNNDC
jgi:hypothetical protein